MKKTIIIFRFSIEPLVCLNRLELLKLYNPDTPIYGIYGGEEDELPLFTKILSEYMYDIYTIKDKSSDWKWKNFDLALREWYKDVGKSVDFDMAYICEWDLLIFGPLAEIYAGINCGDVGLTGTIPLRLIEKQWYWTLGEARTEYDLLMNFVIEHYKYASMPLATLAPGLCFPKSFLKDYCDLDIPELCHDEIRMPLVAQILNYPIKDTGFFKGWFNQDARIYFNCDRRLIYPQIIANELKSNRRKVFHPFRDVYPLESIENLSI